MHVCNRCVGDALVRMCCKCLVRLSWVQFAEAEQTYRRLVREANACQYQVHMAQVRGRGLKVHCEGRGVVWVCHDGRWPFSSAGGETRDM